jgi:spoIIIJ-associated protein
MSASETLIKTLLQHLTFDHAEVEYEETEESFRVTLTLPEAESGILIGYHGEKIDALQLLLGLMLNHDTVAYKPVELDVNGYRAKRRLSLEDLAEKAAQKALESGREILLPPLPSHERRLIHLYLSQNSAVTTYSEGEGQDRRLVVRPASAGEVTSDES